MLMNIKAEIIQHVGSQRKNTNNKSLKQLNSSMKLQQAAQRTKTPGALSNRIVSTPLHQHQISNYRELELNTTILQYHTSHSQCCQNKKNYNAHVDSGVHHISAIDQQITALTQPTIYNQLRHCSRTRGSTLVLPNSEKTEENSIVGKNSIFIMLCASNKLAT